MPYARSKKSYRSRRSIRKPRVSKSVKSYVRKAVHSQIENKEARFGATYPLISNTGTLIGLNQGIISPGTGNGQRTGGRVKFQRLKLNIKIFGNTSERVLRMMLIRSAKPVTTATLPAFLDPVNYTIASYKVDMDRLITISNLVQPSSTTGDDVDANIPSLKVLRFNKYLPMHTVFESGTATVSRGFFYLYMVSSNSTGGPDVQISYALSYEDA